MFFLFVIFLFVANDATALPRPVLRVPFYGLVQRPSHPAADPEPPLMLLEFEGKSDSTSLTSNGSTFRRFAGHGQVLENNETLFLRRISYGFAAGYSRRMLDSFDFKIREMVFLRGSDPTGGTDLILVKTDDERLAMMDLNKSAVSGTLEARVGFHHAMKNVVAVFPAPGQVTDGPGAALVVFGDGSMELFNIPGQTKYRIPGTRPLAWYDEYSTPLPGKIPHKKKVVLANRDAERNLFIVDGDAVLHKFSWDLGQQFTELGQAELNGALRSYSTSRGSFLLEMHSVSQMMVDGDDVLLLAKLYRGMQADGYYLVHLMFTSGGNARVVGVAKCPTKNEAPSIFQFDAKMRVGWISLNGSLHQLNLEYGKDGFDTSLELLNSAKLSLSGVSDVPIDARYNLQSWAPLEREPQHEIYRRVLNEFRQAEKKLTAASFPALDSFPTREIFSSWLRSSNMWLRVHDFYRAAPHSLLGVSGSREAIPEFEMKLAFLGFRLQAHQLVPLDETMAEGLFDPRTILLLFAHAEFYQSLHGRTSSERCAEALAQVLNL